MKHIKLFEEFVGKVNEVDMNKYEIKNIEHDIALCKKSKSANLRRDFSEIIKLGLKTIENLSEGKVNEDESVEINEDVEYSVNDFPIGADVSMGDEVWKVVKPGTRGEKIFMAPFNAEAKRRYISIAIEFDLNWLNANITNISK